MKMSVSVVLASWPPFDEAPTLDQRRAGQTVKYWTHLRAARRYLTAPATRKRLAVAGHHVISGNRERPSSRTVFEFAQLSFGCRDVGLSMVQRVDDGTVLSHEADQPS